MRFVKVIVSLFIICATACNVHAQAIKNIDLDSLTVVAVKGGFSVSEFIDLVKQDTSFYKAFKNLKYYPYQSEGHLVVFNKDQNEKAVMERKATQFVKNKHRWLVIDQEKVSGKLYNRKKKFNYYTAELFDYVFYPRDTAYASNIINTEKKGDSKNKSNEDKLKVLIFNPGAEVAGVPLIGDRMAIFDPDMVKYYDYKISSETYKDTVKCYVFTCRAKQDLGYFTKDKPVIKELVSYFDKKTFNIVSRKYVLSYSSALFDFDVKMHVNLTTINGALVPEVVSYHGNWDIPFKQAEIVDFNLRFFNYLVNQ